MTARHRQRSSAVPAENHSGDCCAMLGLTCATFIFATTTSLATADLPLSVPVRLLNSNSPAETTSSPQAMPQPDERLQPTTPAGKLPQYRIKSYRNTSASKARTDNPRLRFLLALPDQIVLLEATITIDGKPYTSARERRIQDIVAALNQKDKTNVPERIQRYVAATGETPTAEEVRWVLETWDVGPQVLMLKDNFQRFRAQERPVFHILDRDRDGVISEKELEQAVQSFKECDLNRDDIVLATEIATAAKDPRRQPQTLTGSARILFRIPTPKSAAEIYGLLARRYSQSATPVVPRFDANANGRFDPEEIKQLAESTPDVALSVEFNTKEPEKSKLQITSIADELKSDDAVRQRKEINIRLKGTPVAFSAVQAGSDDRISFGAVHDGFPLLPQVDLNDDGRFTIRELRQLVAKLKSFDRNKDGRLTADETRSTVRVCIGLGPWVHRPLAGVRSVNPKPQTPPVTGPDWFVRMDRNKDNDLTRSEFPGTDKQFADLDADQDGLISAAEALEFDRKSKGENQ